MIEDRAAGFLERIDACLEALLPDAGEEPGPLHQAMRYAVLAPGKRMRPLLVYGAGEALGLDHEQLDDPACAIELVHAYSLIHDDLPAMDDDDLRRGRPTCHKAFDEATAILAGDALQALAFEVLAASRTVGCAPDRHLELVSRLARACGSRGMAGGQAIDLAAVGHALDRPALERMHLRKTGALIRCAVELPALIAGDDDAVHTLAAFGDRIGLAFQIQDDVLDVEGTTEAIGKPRGSDLAHDKPTFTSCLGVDASKHLARSLLDEALALLQGLPGDHLLLEYLARFTVERQR